MSSSTPSPSLAAPAPAETVTVVVKKEFGADDDDGSHDRSENQVIVFMYSAVQINLYMGLVHATFHRVFGQQSIP